MVSTDRWTLTVPDGWMAGNDDRHVVMRPPDDRCHVTVADLRLNVVDPSLAAATMSVTELLDAASADRGRVLEPPVRFDDGRVKALGRGCTPTGFVSAGAHLWTGTVVLLTLFASDDDLAETARAIFVSLATMDAPQSGALSSLKRLIGR